MTRSEARRPTGYTTVLKLLQIMTEKGLVRRDETERAHVYEARVPREETERQLVTDLLDRAFAGSASALVMRALSSKKASPQELARIRGAARTRWKEESDERLWPFSSRTRPSGGSAGRSPRFSGRERSSPRSCPASTRLLAGGTLARATPPAARRSS